MNQISTPSTQKIISITSQSHSGSTVLSMALACHWQLVSLGEIYQVLREQPDFWLDDPAQRCSCGAHASECSFWRVALSRVKQQQKHTGKPDKADIRAGYQIVLDTFREQFADLGIVDTSKGEDHISLLSELKNADPQVIFLLRDVRSFAVSQTRLARLENRKGFKKAKGHYWYQMVRWYTRNRKREANLIRSGLSYQQIGYEAFCFDVRNTLARTFEKCGLEPADQERDIHHSEHHVLFGNPMRLNASAHQQINYDDRWFKETGYQLPLTLMPFVMRYNREKVYAVGK